MNDLNVRHEQSPSRLLAGALAHLAQHMEHGCPRAAYLAAMLLQQIADDASTDDHLRVHARQLVEILETDSIQFNAAQSGSGMHRSLDLPGATMRRCA